jgi:hypothetical protein
MPEPRCHALREQRPAGSKTAIIRGVVRLPFPIRGQAYQASPSFLIDGPMQVEQFYTPWPGRNTLWVAGVTLRREASGHDSSATVGVHA